MSIVALVLSLLGGGGGIGVLAYFVGPAKLLGIGRSIFGFLAKIPWQIYAAAAVLALIAFLFISRSHALDQARADEARLAEICQAVRDAAGRPRQDCRLAPLQIRALGASVKDLEAALADQNARIRELGRQSAAQQAAAAKARKDAEKRAKSAESVAERLERSSKIAPAVPCAVSQELGKQWQ